MDCKSAVVMVPAQVALDGASSSLSFLTWMVCNGLAVPLLVLLHAPPTPRGPISRRVKGLRGSQHVMLVGHPIYPWHYALSVYSGDGWCDGDSDPAPNTTVHYPSMHLRPPPPPHHAFDDFANNDNPSRVDTRIHGSTTVIHLLVDHHPMTPSSWHSTGMPTAIRPLSTAEDPLPYRRGGPAFSMTSLGISRRRSPPSIIPHTTPLPTRTNKRPSWIEL